MTKDELISYWIRSSDIDFESMENLVESGNYHWALFIGHLVIEKILKAYYVKMIDENVPYIHDLLRIADKSKLSLTADQENFLDDVTGFNINARYDDYKFKFYKLCTKEFTLQYFEKIKEFRSWIKNML